MRPSLIDYYDFLIQEHLGSILPAEDSNVAEVPAKEDFKKRFGTTNKLLQLTIHYLVHVK